MNRSLLLPCLFASATSLAQAPVSFHLFAEMNGVHETAAGGEIPIWGYGWADEGFITLPAPLLTCMEGDSVHVTMDNPSPESHTIHWHGLDVDQANDGVPSTSFLIPTDSSATYSFRADHSGTYLYHCHVTTTLHLTMGMYGMFVVDRPDGSLFEGGPTPDFAVPLLFSDLELATNFNPTGAFPFHDIRPNYFMINGRNGAQLEAPDGVIDYTPGDLIALRLGSMAYSRIDVHVPTALNATVVMSDGRPVPPLTTELLQIYPGERFTLLFEAPATGWDGTLACDFVMMADDEYEQTQTIHFNNLVAGVDAVAGASDAWNAAPNPTADQVSISRVEGLAGSWVVRDLTGRLVAEGVAPAGPVNIDLALPAAGQYLFTGPGGQTTRLMKVADR